MEKIPLKRKPADVFSLEELVKLFDLRGIDDVWEGWGEWLESSALGAACYYLDYDFDYETWEITKDCDRCDGTGYVETVLTQEDVECNICNGSGQVEVDLDDLRDTPDYERELSIAGGSLYKAWEDAISTTLEKYFGWHNLDLVEVVLIGNGKSAPREQTGYRIVPQKSWQDSAQCLADTISGYGMFWYENAKELKDVGPYATYKHAFLSHIHWMAYYGEVYGVKSMQRMFEDEFEGNTRGL